MSILYDFAIATFYSLPILFWYRIKLKLKTTKSVQTPEAISEVFQKQICRQELF